MEKPDLFRESFRMQKALNERIGVHAADMNEEEKTKWILLKAASSHVLERKAG